MDAQKEVLERKYMRRSRRVVPDRMNPFVAMSDDEFVNRFRLKKESVNSIIQEIQHGLPVANDRRGNPVPPHLQVLITLACMASGSHQAVIGDCYDVSQARVSQCLSRVARAIAFLSNRYIQYPARNMLFKVMNDFQAIAGMPDVVGCIDCTHIKILRPSRDDSELFQCREGFFSLNIQAICGPDLVFYNIVSRWPGSVHDSKIFENSRIYNELQDGLLHGHLLGDSGYHCSKYLLTPLMNPNGPHEEAYNRSHIKTRNTIERAFGVLKRRFCYLGTTMRTNLDTTKAIIVASAVLHNIAIHTKLDMEEEVRDVHADMQHENINVPDNDPAMQNNNAALQGRLKREQIIRDYF